MLLHYPTFRGRTNSFEDTDLKSTSSQYLPSLCPDSSRLIFFFLIPFRQSRSPHRNSRRGLVNRSDLLRKRCLDSYHIIRRPQESLLPIILHSRKTIKISSFSNFDQDSYSTLAMDMSTQLPMAGYFIYRSGEQADPTALEFCPPKGSDELFFALKVAYPHVKTHSDRMRNAVIEFLKQELTEEQTMAAPAIPMDSDLNYDLSTESPWSSWPSMDSTTSTLSSPDLLNLATPASMTSSYAPTMSRQNSSSQANTSQKAKPGLEEMTGVFSLSSTSQPKTRVRRKMTESEKLEYRKRRIVKACDSCSKRKRKCSHNQPEMEKVRSSKVTKPKVAAASTIHPARVEQIEKAVFQPAEPAILAEDPFMFLDQSLFSDLPATDPLFLDNAGTYNLFEPQVSQASEQVSSTAWPWSDTPDWTLIDTPLLTQASPSSPSYHQALFPASTGLLSPQPTPQLELMHEPAEQVETRESPTTEQTPTRTWRTFSDFSRTAFSTSDGLDGKEQSASMGLSTPGDMMSPSQLRDQHSSSATLLGTQSSLSSSDSRRERSTMPSGSQQTSSELVPQANGLTSTIRPEGQRLQGNGRIGGSGLINGLSHAISPQVTIAQSGEELRHVTSEGAASSPTTLGDRRIGNPINASSTGTYKRTLYFLLNILLTFQQLQLPMLHIKGRPWDVRLPAHPQDFRVSWQRLPTSHLPRLPKDAIMDSATR